MSTTLASRIAAPFWRVTGWLFRRRPDPRDAEVRELRAELAAVQFERDHYEMRTQALRDAATARGYIVIETVGRVEGQPVARLEPTRPPPFELSPFERQLQQEHRERWPGSLIPVDQQGGIQQSGLDRLRSRGLLGSLLGGGFG